MIPDSLAPGIVIRAPDKTSARESGDEANLDSLCSSVCKTSMQYVVSKQRVILQFVAKYATECEHSSKALRKCIVT